MHTTDLDTAGSFEYFPKQVVAIYSPSDPVSGVIVCLCVVDVDERGSSPFFADKLHSSTWSQSAIQPM